MKPKNKVLSGRIILECGNDGIFDTLSMEFLRHYRRAVIGKKKSKFDKALVEAIKLNKIVMNTESDPEKRGGNIIFEMTGTEEELEEWTKFNLLDRAAIKLFSKTGVLKLKKEIDK